MRKVLVFAGLLVFGLVGCGSDSGGGGGSKGGFYQNTVNGKQVDFTAITNNGNISDNSRQWVFFVSGETFDLKSVFWVQDPDDKRSYVLDDTDPDLANTVWSITGNLGYFVSEGNTTTSGATVSITFTASGGTAGTVSVENGELKCTYPIKIAATQADLP